MEKVIKDRKITWRGIEQEYSNGFFKVYFMVFEPKLSIAHKIFSKISYSLTSWHQICFKNMQRNSMYLKVGKKDCLDLCSLA